MEDSASSRREDLRVFSRHYVANAESPSGVRWKKKGSGLDCRNIA